jgi:hypothetical protein
MFVPHSNAAVAEDVESLRLALNQPPVAALAAVHAAISTHKILIDLMIPTCYLNSRLSL